VIPDDKAVQLLLNTAKDLDVNFIDTAPAYGSSEERLGELLPGKREDWIIASKAGEDFVDGQSSYCFSREHLTNSVKRSLQRLKTDYLDIVLIHSNGDDLTIIDQEGALDTLAELKKEGLIRATGMSTKTIEGGRRCLDLADLAMVTYNPVETECKSVIDYAYTKNKGILIKKAFASGHLCANKKECTTKGIFKFVFDVPGVTSVIIGTMNPAHLRENVLSLS